MESSSLGESRGLILRLRFEATSGAAPRPEEIAAVLGDVEGLYRSAPAAVALGVPVVALLSQYHVARAEAAAEPPISPREWRRFGRLLSPEFDEFLYLTARLRRASYIRPYGLDALPAPENAIRVRRLTLASPLELLVHIPVDYWTGGGFLVFLAALERRFNMVDRIRTERVDLRAQRAERRADEREAELREEKAARALEGLRQDDAPFRLIEGEAQPDDGDDATQADEESA